MVVDFLRSLVDLVRLRSRRAAAELSQLRPLIQEARDFFTNAAAEGGRDASEMIESWGPIERRLQEMVISDKKLRVHLDALRARANEAWAKSPPTMGYVVGPGNPVIPAEYVAAQRRKGEVAELARECEAHAIAALRRMSELRGRAQQ